jgi:DNA primase catalytic core
LAKSSSTSWEELKDRVKANTDLAGLVSPHAKLQKTARGYKACCPLPGHREKTPSFHINSTENFYHCFGCGRSGDVFSFLEVVEGLTFIESLKELAGRLGYELPSESSFNKKESEQEKSRFQSGLELLKRAETFFHRNLRDAKSNDARQALEYLHKRGIDDEEINELQLGWAPEGGKVLLSKLSEEERKLAEDIKLVGVYSGRSYDFFSDRLMIPINDSRGRVRGFSGRTLREVDSKNPKYKNSTDSDYFKKKEILYGLDRAVKFIREDNVVCIVEGYFDQWALLRKGIPAVAVMGTALGIEHLNALRRHTRQIVLFLDSDEAGRRSTLRSLPLLYKDGFDVKVFALDTHKDPDEWLQAQTLSRDEILDELKKSPDALEWWIHQIIFEGQREGFSKLRILESLGEPWHTAQSDTQRNVLAEEVSRRLGLAANEVKVALHKAPRGQPESRAETNRNSQQENTSNFNTYRRPPSQAALGACEKIAVQTAAWVSAHWSTLVPPAWDAWEMWLTEWHDTPLHGVWSHFGEWAKSHGHQPDFAALRAWIESDQCPEAIWKDALIQGFVLEMSSTDKSEIRESYVELLRSLAAVWVREKLNLMQGELRLHSGNSQKTAQLLHEIHQLRIRLEKAKKTSTVQ